jgi:hypothetical protein
MVYVVNANGINEKELVDLLGVIVTGVNTVETVGHPIFVQIPPDSPAFDGYEHSGMYVYLRKTELVPAVGDLINVRGQVYNEDGWAWINYGRAVEILSSNNPLPPPVLASPAELATGGARQIPLQAVRVQVDDVRVTNLAPTPSPDDPNPGNEFVLAASLRVDDFLYLHPNPLLGDHFDYVRGILHSSYGQSRLLPGGSEDLLRMPRLSHFDPASLSMQLGSMRQMRVILDQTWSTDLQISLSSSSAALNVPSSVTIDAGELSAEFTVEGVSAANSAELQAEYDGESITANIQVLDVPQVAVASISPSFQKWQVNSQTAFTIELESAAPIGGQMVFIDSPGSNFNKLSVPVSVIVPEGELLFDVPVQTKSGTGSATISAYTSANSTWPSTEIQVVQAYPIGFLLAEVLYNPNFDDDQREWVVLYNGTGTRLELSEYELRMANSSNPNFSSPLYRYALPDRELGIGECLLVGGPVSDAENGSPVYDLSQDFNPDLNNATSAQSAAVAIFSMSGTQGDTVIYGGNGSNPGNLKDADGSTAIDIADSAMSTGASIKRRQDALWEANTSPSPNLCPPF